MALLEAADPVQHGHGGAAGAPAVAAHRRAAAAGQGLLPGRVLAELDHPLQRARVRGGRQPEQLRPAAALVQVHLDGLLLTVSHKASEERRCLF